MNPAIGSSQPEALIRPFRPDDSALLLEWRNHPSHRQQSFRSDPIPEEEHRAWFARFLAMPGNLGLILEAEGKPLAQVRFECGPLPGTARVSVAVSPGSEGRGLGFRVLSGSMVLPEVLSLGIQLRAETLSSNTASMRLFQKAGFLPVSQENREGKGFVEWRFLPRQHALREIPFSVMGLGSSVPSVLEGLKPFGLVPSPGKARDQASKGNPGTHAGRARHHLFLVTPSPSLIRMTTEGFGGPVFVLHTDRLEAFNLPRVVLGQFSGYASPILAPHARIMDILAFSGALLVAEKS